MRVRSVSRYLLALMLAQWALWIICSKPALGAGPEPSLDADESASDDDDGDASADIRFERVTFPSDGMQLVGRLWKQPGSGPFPVVVSNHGSGRGSPVNPGPRHHTRAPVFYLAHGYAFFAPQRRGHYESPGPFFADQLKSYAASHRGKRAKQQLAIRLHEDDNRDVVAAVRWIRERPFVDPTRVVVSGISFGGIQALLTAEKGHRPGICSVVAFAPGAMSWAANPLVRDRLRRAVQDATVPIFILQAANDYSLGPSAMLAPLLKAKGPPNRSRIYPAFGTTPNDGHAGFYAKAQDIWGPDVLEFLARTVPSRSR